MRDIDELAVKAADNETAFEQLVESQKGFLTNCVFRATHRYVTKSDDEWSVALMAFSSATKTYSPEKGGFLGYAGIIVHNRLVDWYRKESRHGAETSVDPIAFDTEPGDDSDAIALHMEIAEKVSENKEVSLKEEIEAANAVFSDYGFCFMDLARCSPKSQKTREACRQAVLALCEDPEIQQELLATRQLPVKKIQKKTGLPRKLLENHRRYLIAANELLSGGYPGLAEYLTFIKKAGQ